MVLLRTQVVEDEKQAQTSSNSNAAPRHHMPNALESGLGQMHELSLLTDSSPATDEYIDSPTHPVVLATYDWARLWHQVYLFVHANNYKIASTPKGQKEPETVTFRSLLADKIEFFTGAYARIMTEAFTPESISAMLRLQLEELSMDEEEHEELKSQLQREDEQGVESQ